jgi:hypothetical protein
MENLSYFVVVNKHDGEEFSPCDVQFYPDGVEVSCLDNYGEYYGKFLKNGQFEIQRREHTVNPITKAEEVENRLREKENKLREEAEREQKRVDICNELKKQYSLFYKGGKKRMNGYLCNVKNSEKHYITKLVKLITQFTKEFSIDAITNDITNDLYLEFVKYANEENNPYLTYDLFKSCIYSNTFDKLEKERLKELD